MFETFSKGMVDPDELALAMATGSPADFERIRLTGTAKLVNPRAGLDPRFLPEPPPELRLPPPQAPDSPEVAAALIEQALAVVLCDHPFRDIRAWFSSNPNPLEGLESLLNGPTRPASVFRHVEQQRATPYISQLLLLPVTAGAHVAEQKYIIRTGFYGTTAETQAAMLKGAPIETQTYGPPRYINNLRALASAFHKDPPYQVGLNACHILDGLEVQRSSLFPPLPSEVGFVSYGGAVQIQCLLPAAVELAMSAALHEKWYRSRFPRPEELTAEPLKLHPLWLERTGALLARWGGRLPTLYREGCPMHSSYPSGHAVIGGAATLMKAMYQEGAWPRPLLQSSPDGTALIAAGGAATIHGEIDKLAWLSGFGRIPIHTRIDYLAGLDLGEAAAVLVLREAKARAEAVEPWGTTTFRGFRGQQITI